VPCTSAHLYAFQSCVQVWLPIRAKGVDEDRAAVLVPEVYAADTVKGGIESE
jgi:hypothetical protein